MSAIKDLLQGRLFGHPIHMMLVHFPAALFPVSAALSIVSYYFSNFAISLMNFYIVCIGAAMGWIALIFGTIELIRIQYSSKPFRIALIHGGLNTLWLMFFSILAGVQFKYYPQIPVPSLLEVICELLVVLGMLYSNFLGGELVLRFQVGRKVID